MRAAVCIRSLSALACVTLALAAPASLPTPRGVRGAVERSGDGRVSPKRGFVADGCKGSACLDPLRLSSAGWYYSYNVEDPYEGVPGLNDTSRFTPMFWCVGSVNNTIPPTVNASLLMGFNEPNLASQCNISPEYAARTFGELMKRFPQSSFVTPATAGDGISWLDGFFAACHSMYGDHGCNTSFVAVHDYSCDSQQIMGYLQQLHDRYRHPVWLTEFACGATGSIRPLADQISFMKDIVPKLEAASYVARYAWMSARDPDNNGLRALVTSKDGVVELTELGKLYNSL